MKLTEEFLLEKIQRLLSYWEEKNEHSTIGRVYRSLQLCETESGNLCFVIYNLLGFLEGHYLFTVNLDTFEYAIKMYSRYGSLTWTTPPTSDRVFRKDDLPEDVQMHVEAYIAYTLYLSQYFGRPYTNVVSLADQRLVSGKQWYTDLLNDLT